MVSIPTLSCSNLPNSLASALSRFLTGLSPLAFSSWTSGIFIASICVLAPVAGDIDSDTNYPVIASATQGAESQWLPFVKSPQRLSQTLTGINRGADGEFSGFKVYAKRISSNSSPAKTSIIITGEESGAVYEYDVTVSYYTS